MYLKAKCKILYIFTPANQHGGSLALEESPQQDQNAGLCYSLKNLYFNVDLSIWILNQEQFIRAWKIFAIYRSHNPPTACLALGVLCPTWQTEVLELFDTK